MGIMHAIELFAGAGGLLLGSSMAGIEHDAAVEWEHNSCNTLRLNQERGYPSLSSVSILEGDVRDVDWNRYKNVDLLSGGPPCQPFSLGGLARAALDERDMFPAMTNALAHVAPKAFIVENVKGLLRQTFSDYYSYVLLRLQHPCLAARAGETWREHYVRLSKEHTKGVHDDLRYELVPTLVDAADYGVPQHRHRVVIVGFRSDIKAEWKFPAPTHSGAALYADQDSGVYWERHGLSRRKPVFTAPPGDPGLRPWRTVRDALCGLPNPKPSVHSHCIDRWPMNHMLREGAKVYPGHTGSDVDAPSKAIKAGVHGVPGGENMLRYRNGLVRYYSVREAARLQTFPDEYAFSGSWTEAMRQIGNAVPVRLATVVASSVAVVLEKDAAVKHRELQSMPVSLGEGTALNV